MEPPRVPVPARGMTLAEYLARLTPQQRAERDVLLASHPARRATPDPREEPILADLRAIGVEVHSVWSQFLQRDEDPRVYEVLMHHLQRGHYDQTVKEGLASKFARRGASRYWWSLRELYLTAPDGLYRDALAYALSESSKREHLDSMLELLHTKALGPSRVMLMRGLKRIGGRQGLAAIEALRDDPELGSQARHLTKSK